MKKVSRREFLKGSLAGAAALTLSGIGVGTAAAETEAVVEVEEPPETYAPLEKIPAAYLNPQRTDFRTHNKELKTLFTPFMLGSLQLNHRMVKSAAGSACYLAGLTDELLQYYVNFAKGGVELILVEGIPELEPPEDGSPMPAATLAFGKKLLAECAKYGASLGYQWAQFGMNENEMSPDDIHGIQARGVAIAKSMQEMGFQLIEMNAAGFNMGEHFLSRFYNTRTDA